MNRSVFVSPNYDVDSFLEHYDLQAGDKAKVKRYEELILKTSLTDDETIEFTNLTASLREKIFTPEDFNKLQDCIVNMQKFIKDNVEGYIQQKQNEFNATLLKFTDKGEYNPATVYMRWNIVTLNGESFLCKLDNTVGISPNPDANTDNWYKIASRGAKGDKGDQGSDGLGIVFIDEPYRIDRIYHAGEGLQYEGSLYVNIQDCSGITPSDDGINWRLAVSKGGSSVVAFKENSIVITSPTVNVQIGISIYNSTNDLLLVHKNTTFLRKGVDYKINANGISIDKIDGTVFDASTESPVQFDFLVIKNVVTVVNMNDGGLLQDKSVTKFKLTQSMQDTLDNADNHIADTNLHPRYGRTTGTNNAYQVTLDPAPISITEGFPITVKIHADCTGASTLSVNGMVTGAIKKANGMDVTNLKANGIYTMRYDGVNFTLQGEGASGNAIASHLLSGDKATTDAGDIEGTMPNNPSSAKATVTTILKNIVANGSFETLADWLGSGTLDTTRKKFGNASIRLESIAGEVKESYKTISLINGHKYYGSVWAFRVGSINGTSQFDITGITPEMDFSSLTNVTIPQTNTWTMLSGIQTSTITGNGNIRCYSLSTSGINVDGMSLIDLTDIFGAGNEPTKIQMDAIMLSLGGWLDGNVLLTKIENGGYINVGASGKQDIVLVDPNFNPDNLKKDTTIFGMKGTKLQYGTGDYIDPAKLGFPQPFIVLGLAEGYTIGSYNNICIGNDKYFYYRNYYILKKFNKSMQTIKTYAGGSNRPYVDFDITETGVVVFCYSNPQDSYLYFLQPDFTTLNSLVMTNNSFYVKNIKTQGDYAYTFGYYNDYLLAKVQISTRSIVTSINLGKESDATISSSGCDMTIDAQGYIYIATNKGRLYKYDSNLNLVLDKQIGVGSKKLMLDTSGNLYIVIGTNLYKYDSNLNLIWGTVAIKDANSIVMAHDGIWDFDVTNKIIHKRSLVDGVVFYGYPASYLNFSSIASRSSSKYYDANLVFFEATPALIINRMTIEQ